MSGQKLREGLTPGGVGPSKTLCVKAGREPLSVTEGLRAGEAHMTSGKVLDERSRAGAGICPQVQGIPPGGLCVLNDTSSTCAVGWESGDRLRKGKMQG